MSVSREDPAALADLFADFGAVTPRRLFGGAGIYADGVMFALAHGGKVYLKADDATVAAFREREEVVQPFKCGPDFLDSGHHSAICGRVSSNGNLPLRDSSSSSFQPISLAYTSHRHHHPLSSRSRLAFANNVGQSARRSSLPMKDVTIVCDGSSLVTSGRGQPTMTIEALAFRAAEHIGQSAKRHEI